MILAAAFLGLGCLICLVSGLSAISPNPPLGMALRVAGIADLASGHRRAVTGGRTTLTAVRSPVNPAGLRP
ncbi:hypothetical protein GCM10028833_33540 [Glycomyces tarimensis]